MRKSYPSDISKELFETQVLPIIRKVKKRTNKTKIDLYEVFCAILYVLKTGCQWRHLPHDFPNHNTVYYYFKQWKELDNNKSSAFIEIYEELRSEYRTSLGKNEKLSFGIIDSQSVKNSDTSETKGYDGAKKNQWDKKAFLR